MEVQEGETPQITPIELKDRLDRQQPLILLDVREPHERGIADLPEVGQRRIPVKALLERIEELDPDDNLVVYCRSGARSRWAVNQLRERGFGKVFNLEGGVLGWREHVDPSLEKY